MEFYRKETDLFIRLEPGERLVDSLSKLAKEQRIDFALITSGVGMIEGTEMGFFCVNDNAYDTYRIAGVYDLSSISGNISNFNGEPRPHVHIVANRPDFSTISGHLIECKTHITIEIGLRVLENSGIVRKAEVRRPATFLTRNV